ncbi:MAG TPA: hypothetical protein DFR83_28090, partial [Deltaproteobacteria bacterium]|nr:hypothetical protein [Deltaproteobacteria bacterium]
MALSQQTTVRLLGGGDARGLSGDVRRVLQQRASLDFFDACLQRHRSIADLVVDPDQIWDIEVEDARPVGLKAHLQTASPERLTALVDVLVIVSDHDWERAHQNHGDRWLRHVVGVLRASFEAWCAQQQIQRRNPHRPLGIRVLVDGSHDMFGERVGLGPGEFVTGLLPNLYSGAALASRGLLSVMINLPGQWDGYREVARLYDDQDLLTLGNHWLDNFSHPALEVPALYRLQYHPVEGLVHLTNPDTEGVYSLTRHDAPDGASVYGVVRPDGHVVVWLILAVIEPTAAFQGSGSAFNPHPTLDSVAVPDGGYEPDPEAETVADRSMDGPLGKAPTVGPEDETLADDALPVTGLQRSLESSDTQRPAVADAGPHDPTLSDDCLGDLAGEHAVSAEAAPSREEPSASVAPPASAFRGTVEAAGLERGLFSIREAGVLLQRVHFRAIMLGYEVYIGASGDIGSDLPDPAATVQVVGRHVRIFAHIGGI